jgi:cellobiose phosphorylase
VETGTPSNAHSPRGNSVGSLTHDIELAPGEERQIVFIMGATERPAEIGRVVARFSDPSEVAPHSRLSATTGTPTCRASRSRRPTPTRTR